MSLFDLAAEYDMLPRGATALCAVSGGADSMYLLANLLERREETGCAVVAAHFDHGLRENSGRDAQFVADWCAAHGVTCVLGAGDVAAEAKRQGTGIEETARTLRYAFLQKTAEELGADVIVTAHNADDNAETLLMNLTRGSGLEGLCGIPPRRGNIVRPLLTTTRGEIEAWLTEHDIPHVEDETNADETYTRNFLRHRVMPLLKQINPKAAQHMTAAAARLRRDNDALNAQAARLSAAARPVEDGFVISVRAFDLAADPVALRAVGQLARRVGAEELSAIHRNAVVNLIRGDDPSAMLDLPGAMVRRVYGDVLFTPRQETDGPPMEQPVEQNGVTVWGAWTVTCTRGVRPENAVDTAEEFWISAEKPAGTLLVRSRREGDDLKPPGRPHKSVKKWFIDEKLPRHLRAHVPVLWDGERVAAVGSIGPEETMLARAGETAFHLILKNEGAEICASGSEGNSL